MGKKVKRRKWQKGIPIDGPGRQTNIAGPVI